MSYNANIPQSTDLISQSQSQILTNFGQINTQFAVDHVAFDAASDNGKHKQIAFDGNHVAGAQTGFQSTLYTDAGTADATAAALFWRNKNNIFPFPIKAWALCNGTIASPTNCVVNSQSFNITSVIRASTGTYTVTMGANVVATADYSVLVTCSNSSIAPTTDSVLGGLATDVSSPTTTTFSLRTFRQGLTVTDAVRFSFVVFQL